MMAMDAAAPSATPTFASRTPLHVGAVGLVARDLDRLTAFYRDLLGLTVFERTARLARLGAGETMLLHIEHRATAKPDDPAGAGLYHTAFLMPTRADLARWILHVAHRRVPITGASDHGVSEAIYLDDPEGNGIEVYSDRPREQWQREGRQILQRTDPLDIEAIIREVDPATATFTAAPAGLRIGHVHLRVGDIASAERFYCGALGLDVTRRRTGATFLSSGGYHHHVGANVWHSRGAGRRDDDSAGLAWFSLEAADAAAFDSALAGLRAADAPLTASGNGIETLDPWGTRLRLVRG